MVAEPSRAADRVRAGRLRPMWVVYDHPADQPEHFVAREWVVFPSEAWATDSIILADDIEKLRTTLLVDFGLTKLDRDPGDDPVIMETWL